MLRRSWNFYRSMSSLAILSLLVAFAALAGGLIWAIAGAGEVAAAILIASVPVTLTLMGQFLSSNQQHKREIELKLRESKKDAYDVFVKWWITITTDKSYQQKLIGNPNLLAKEMAEVSQPMMLWASNDVVKSVAEWRILQGFERENATEDGSLRNLRQFEKILFRMREDMGHDRENVPDYYLLALIINDAHKYVDRS